MKAIEFRLGRGLHFHIRGVAIQGSWPGSAELFTAATSAMKLLALISVLVLLSSCSDPCANRTKAEVTSPDGKYIATAFIRDCGATASFSPQVHLRPVGERLAQTGNVFIGDQSENVRLTWLSASQLVIYSDCRVVQHLTNFHGIVIEKRDTK
jgi:hypothetical protein